jgi:hypothetical protein
VISDRNPLLAKDSPLTGALPLGSIIKSINYVDVPTQGRWNDLFSGNTVPLMSGWCLPRQFVAGEMSRSGIVLTCLLRHLLMNLTFRTADIVLRC